MINAQYAVRYSLFPHCVLKIAHWKLRIAIPGVPADSLLYSLEVRTVEKDL